MAQTDLHRLELEFMQDWDAGKQPALHEYVARCPGDAHELMEFVADYIIFEAVAPMGGAAHPPTGHGLA